MPLSEASNLLNGRVVAETWDTFLSSALVRFLRRSEKIWKLEELWVLAQVTAPLVCMCCPLG